MLTGGYKMKYAADFRADARSALRNKWGLAVLTGLVATLLGGTGIEGPKFNLDIGNNSVTASFKFAGTTIYSFGGSSNSDTAAFIIEKAPYFIWSTLILCLLFLLLGSIIAIGYARFNLALTDREMPSFGVLFSCFPIWKTAIISQILQSIYIFLWSLLLVIPGIIATYSYAMTRYILAEHPELTASEAIRRSKEMMYGHRWRLFCLHFSFIGWTLLCIPTLGIGYLWLVPYTQAAEAAFYRELSGSAKAWQSAAF